MLTKEDESHIKEKGFNIDHEWRFYMSVCGEPFLVENCICFFDGSVLTINGWSFDYQPLFGDRLVNILAKERSFSDAKHILIFGPGEIPRGFEIKNYTSRCVRDSSELYADCILSTGTFSLDTLKNARQDLSYANKRNYSSKVLQLPLLTFEHIKLIELFHHTHETSRIDLGFSCSCKSLISMKDIYTLEIRHNNSLIGFCILSEYINHRHLLLHAYFDTSFNGISDFAYNSIIQHVLANNGSYLHLGNSAGSEGLLKFKKKWGAIPDETSPHTYLFSKEPLEPNHFLLGWSERLIQNKIFSNLT